MRTLIATIGFAVVAALTFPAAAQTGAAVVTRAPGAVGVAETVKVTATITAIDKATRAITLNRPIVGIAATPTGNGFYVLFLTLSSDAPSTV